MKTPFANKGDMVSELQTAQHYIQTLGHHSYDIGFTEGCRYCEKVVYERVLEIIDNLDAEAVEDFELDTDKGLAVVHERFAKAREKINALKDGKPEWRI